MIIQINTDKNLAKSENEIARIQSYIEDKLSVYSKDISRIEVHLSDENGNKTGPQDKRCMLEARIEARQPIAVTSYGSTIELAVAEALTKLNAAVKTILGKLHRH